MASNIDIRRTERMATKLKLMLDEFPYDELTERELDSLYDDFSEIRDTLTDLLEKYDNIDTLEEIETREFWNNVLDYDLRRHRDGHIR